ncbi:DUF4377 domain-containing protein [Dysgonomonas sp. Marseille-P4677]|uniref:DUF4377 domain-containing protein n=1 Tax=Dysgonomonas sp. Marseille-P4677 TaxID=2364790 RepID=UPI0019128C2B|nr:DUF4377 domain-containing protein [Dysgonomonas sp. Marseille-P4677]MBK5721061.1 DUF4377 domain-containing protein [Dysgonomonas sp. Marseille-P4677]
MYKVIISLFAISLFLGSCNSSQKTQKTENTEKLTIASQQADCVGVGPMKCLLVKKEGQTDWEFFYNNIEGFQYTPGYEYLLEVKVDTIKMPPADASTLKYTLIKEISKEEKTSENLPQIPVQ